MVAASPHERIVRSMKHEWKKSEKNTYLPLTEPCEITIPAHSYITITGKGDPNGEEFAHKVAALYSLAYAVRMMPKNGFTRDGYSEYTVYPLEGVWSGDVLDKNSYEYTIMIRQPEFVTNEVYTKALEIAKKKKPSPLLDDAKFETIKDGRCVQMMHVGSYATEMQSFAKIQEFLELNGLTRRGTTHREIYITDPSKVEPNKQKTVLRYQVQYC